MGDEQSSGFVRQRRNLMIISLVLLFSEVAQLKVTKLSAFGNELLVGEPNAVATAMWLAGIYWLVRYYQYSRPIFRTSIQGALLPYVQSQGKSIALAKLLTQNAELRAHFPDVPGKLTYEIFDVRNDGITLDYDMDLDFSVRKKAVHGAHVIDQEYGHFKVSLKRSDLGWARTKAWLNLVVNTTQFTELILPYILFSLPVGYAAIRAARRALM